MEKEIFKENLIKNLSEINVEFSAEQIDKLYLYMNLLLEWNKKINLTAITDPKEIITKHFIDSLTAAKYIKEGSSIIDCGTGAGFPGIPLSIYRPDVKFVLIDSLNKRVNFLNEVIEKLRLNNVIAIHTRAEDLAYEKEHREKYDYAVSRAVANMSTLLEYLLPFCKINGEAICMKGANIEEELNNSKKALEVLNSKIEKIDNFVLPFSDYSRNIIIVKKINQVSSKYPRRQGKPAKEPIS